MAEIPSDCLGFVGFDDISKWRMVLNSLRTHYSVGHREGHSNIAASSVHPCMSYSRSTAYFCDEMHDGSGSEDEDAGSSEQELDDASGDVGELADQESEISGAEIQGSSLISRREGLASSVQLWCRT